jgi:hypothetical protein
VAGVTGRQRDNAADKTTQHCGRWDDAMTRRCNDVAAAKMWLMGQRLRLDAANDATIRPTGRREDTADGTVGRQWDNEETMGLTRWMAVAEEGGGWLTQPQERIVVVTVKVEGDKGDRRGGALDGGDGWGRRTKGSTRARQMILMRVAEECCGYTVTHIF